jgi:hypothetical protein
MLSMPVLVCTSCMAKAASREYQPRYPDLKELERHLFARHGSLKQIDTFMPPAHFAHGRRNGIERRTP